MLKIDAVEWKILIHYDRSLGMTTIIKAISCLFFFPGDFDEFTQDNNDIMLKNIAEDLRNCLPLETMLSSEQLALQKVSILY